MPCAAPAAAEPRPLRCGPRPGLDSDRSPGSARQHGERHRAAARRRGERSRTAASVSPAACVGRRQRSRRAGGRWSSGSPGALPQRPRPRPLGPFPRADVLPYRTRPLSESRWPAIIRVGRLTEPHTASTTAIAPCCSHRTVCSSHPTVLRRSPLSAPFKQSRPGRRPTSLIWFASKRSLCLPPHTLTRRPRLAPPVRAPTSAAEAAERRPGRTKEPRGAHRSHAGATGRARAPGPAPPALPTRHNSQAGQRTEPGAVCRGP